MRRALFISRSFAAQALLFCCFASAVVAAAGCEAQLPRTELQFINPDGTSSPKIDAELALSPSEQRLGLMYRKALGDQNGMFFAFPDEKPRSFWMKNTYVELDIIFIDKDFRVVSISEKAVPLTETPRSSTGPAKYVLEVAGGKSKKWGITAGSTAKLSSELPVVHD